MEGDELQPQQQDEEGGEGDVLSPTNVGGASIPPVRSLEGDDLPAGLALCFHFASCFHVLFVVVAICLFSHSICFLVVVVVLLFSAPL